MKALKPGNTYQIPLSKNNSFTIDLLKIKDPIRIFLTGEYTIDHLSYPRDTGEWWFPCNRVIKLIAKDDLNLYLSLSFT